MRNFRVTDLLPVAIVALCATQFSLALSAAHGADAAPGDLPSAVRVERLAILADILDSRVAPANFSMSTWETGEPGTDDYRACAAGYAARLIDDGLVISHDRMSPGPKYRDMINHQALAAYFGISDEDVTELFYPQSYPDGSDPGVVARRLRRFSRCRGCRGMTMVVRPFDTLAA